MLPAYSLLCASEVGSTTDIEAPAVFLTALRQPPSFESTGAGGGRLLSRASRDGRRGLQVDVDQQRDHKAGIRHRYLLKDAIYLQALLPHKSIAESAGLAPSWIR